METNEEGQKQYQESPYRFVIITVYLLASLANSLPFNTFSATTTIVEQAFGTPTILISLNYLIFPISHTVFATLVNWMLTKKGIRVSYYVASVAMISGVWLRTTLSSSNAYLCLFGSLLCGGSGLFILNSASKVTLNWFRSQVVTFVTFLSILSSFISLGGSLIIPGLFLNSNSTAEDYRKFLRLEAIIVTVPFILLSIFIKEKPDKAPSRAAQAQHTHNRDRKYRHTMKLLFKNKNYLKLAASMALTYGIVTAYLSVINKCLKGLGYKQPGKIISDLVTSALIFGILGNYVYSIIIKKTKKYRLYSIVVCFGFFVGYIIINAGFLLELKGFWLIGLIAVIFGFNYFSLPSYFILYGAQLAFPVDQASVAGYLITISNTFGFVLGLIMIAIYDGTRTSVIIEFVIMGVVLLMGSVIVCFVEQDLRKDRYEKSLLSAYTPQQPKSEQQRSEFPVSINRDVSD